LNRLINKKEPHNSFKRAYEAADFEDLLKRIIKIRNRFQQKGDCHENKH